MVDTYDDGRKMDKDERFRPLNLIRKHKRQTAVALKESAAKGDAPTITAAGRGEIAERIIQLAFENGVRVREDSALAEMLAKVELDSPIPSEAFMAVAEILSYIYRANGQADPFNAITENDKNG
ncbi:MAG: EscU/YscU/HrcU family type III secretion system export apparatus switch protein [Alphaproteobacteria bacterium]|nr:EscU/YscU/HrcU family type III secretion system export apparatus switch protein [Alphaproteobacteria bacterium]